MLVTRSQNYLRSEMSRMLVFRGGGSRKKKKEKKENPLLKVLRIPVAVRQILTAPCGGEAALEAFLNQKIRVKRLAIRSQNACYRFHYSLDVLIKRLPVADTDAHGAAAAPGGAAKKCFAGLLDCGDDFISAASEAEPQEPVR